MKRSLAYLLPTFIIFSIILVATSHLVRAGDLVFGPETFIREQGKPKKEQVSFSIGDLSTAFWLQISNGSDGLNLVSSAVIWLNGETVVAPDKFNQQVLGFSEDITLKADNILEVEVRGKPGSFLTVNIRQADVNQTIFNPDKTLWGNNHGDFIALWWEQEEIAAEYVLLRAFSNKGPWEEVARIPLSKGVDFTQEARLRELCYRVEAMDARGEVIRHYAPVCLPAFRENPEENIQDSRHIEDSNSIGKQFTSERFGSFAELSTEPFNTMCLSDSQFGDADAMTFDEIKTFLADRNSFLRGDITDVDGVVINPAQLIFDVAQTHDINPQVLLATLQKESSAVKASVRLLNDTLRFIMGFGNPSTIRDQFHDAAAQFRRDFNRLSDSQPTAGEWQVGVSKESLDPLTVTPASKAVAVLFSYTPWVGQGWGGRTGIGGNFLFCDVWDDFGFFVPPPEPEPSTKFVIGDRVQINTGDGSNLNVRSTPNGSIVGQQTDGAQGTVIGGPALADGFWWWEIDYENDPDGWSAEDFLELAPAPEPEPILNVNSTTDAVDTSPGDGVCNTAMGNCTLRAAIQEANAQANSNTINVPAGVYTLSIAGLFEDAAATGDLDITDNLFIAGEGAANTVIDGGGIDRVFHVINGISVEIRALTIRNGRAAADDGGGLLNEGGVVSIDESVLSNNTANSGDGGAILNLGGMTITRSTVKSNMAESGDGGGIINEGNLATLILTNSTVSGNTAESGNSGGIGNDGGTLELTNSTVTNNTASNGNGGGIENVRGPARLINTIIAENTSLNGSGPDCRGSFTTLGHNLIGDATDCGFAAATGDLVGTQGNPVDPLLGPLQDNGGPTETHALLPGSPAIDAGDNTACPFTDQRGVARPQGSVCDIGAFELE